MPGVGDFDTLGQQAFAAALAAAAENCTPALGLHPGAKAELSLSRALAWLIGAFHKSERMELRTIRNALVTSMRENASRGAGKPAVVPAPSDSPQQWNSPAFLSYCQKGSVTEGPTSNTPRRFDKVR